MNEAELAKTLREQKNAEFIEAVEKNDTEKAMR